MKILMLTPYLPYPPSSGGQVRSYNLIKNLAKNHQITLFSLIKDESEKKFVGELEKFCRKVKVFRRPAKPWTFKNIMKTGFGFYPFLVIRNLCPEEKIAIIGELKSEKYDLIHAENFYVMPHIPRTDVPILLTEQTILYRVYDHFSETLPWFTIFLKPFLKLDVLKLKFWETYFWKKADYLSAVSLEDKEHIQKFTRKRIYIVPNGVDFAHFSQKIFKKSKIPLVLFGAADFHWMQNKEAAEILLKVVWPRIKIAIPLARLWIVGKTAPIVLADFLKLKDVVIEEIKDSREAYQKAWVLVAPMKSGGGSRTKFFEAMASGLPIVTTPEGIEGVNVEWGKQALVEEDLTRLSKAAIKILSSQNLAKKVGEGAMLFSEKKCDWSKSAATLSDIYGKIGKKN